ncbi:MAG: nicotinate-nucleotide adenylyltransferase [Opitutales bacterium]
MENPADPVSTKPRIALYGGAFDPVHRAHLAVARAALRQAALAKVVFIPAAHSPLKSHGPVASDGDRLKMLELALGGEAGFVIDESELRRGGLSYTVDTVRNYQEHAPEAELFWIIGGDQLSQLDRWRAIDELVRRVTFLVLARPGYALEAPELPGLSWRPIDAALMKESSSLVRERLSQGSSVAGLLSPAVEAFIREKGLYS